MSQQEYETFILIAECLAIMTELEKVKEYSTL